LFKDKSEAGHAPFPTVLIPSAQKSMFHFGTELIPDISAVAYLSLAVKRNISLVVAFDNTVVAILEI
jgi:hypothetical protein